MLDMLIQTTTDPNPPSVQLLREAREAENRPACNWTQTDVIKSSNPPSMQHRKSKPRLDNYLGYSQRTMFSPTSEQKSIDQLLNSDLFSWKFVQ